MVKSVWIANYLNFDSGEHFFVVLFFGFIAVVVVIVLALHNGLKVARHMCICVQAHSSMRVLHGVPDAVA